VKPRLAQLLAGLEAAHWAAFDSAALEGILPITDAFLLQVLSALDDQARRGPVNVRSLSILPGNAIRVGIRVHALSWSRDLSPVVQLVSVEGFPQAPTLTVTLPLQYAVVLSRVLRRYVDPERTLLTFDGRRVTVRLDKLIRRASGNAAASVLRLVKTVSVRTEPGRLFVDFRAEAP
jgi:hypothetical protein